MVGKRLIDANDLMEQMAANFAQCVYDGVDSEECQIALDTISEAPTVDAVEVVHGRWVRMDAHKGMERFKCSICRSECYVPTCMNDPMYEYCPNCGARMKGGAGYDR